MSADDVRTARTHGSATAKDGRALAYAIWGDPDGFPILSLHGTPGCRLDRWPNEDLYRELGVCFVTHDRAGYGRSDRKEPTMSTNLRVRLPAAALVLLLVLVAAG